MVSHPHLTVKIARTIKEIPQADWDSVFPEVLESYHFFKTMDESGFDQFLFYYIMIYDNGVPVGAASCFSTRFDLTMGVSGSLKGALDLLNRLIPNILNPKVLMCGLPMGRGHIGLAKNCSAARDVVCDTVEQLARQENATMTIFKDFTPAYDDLLAPLFKRGFFKFESIPSTDLDVRFSNFDDYLKTLSSATRYDLRRKFKKFDGQVKMNLEITDMLEDDALSEAHALYMQTVRKSCLRFEVASKDFFKNISRHMRQKAKYFLWRIDGKMVAFSFCLVSQGYLTDYYLGLDYALAYQHHLYFIRFRDQINWCIANGIKKYEMGMTGYEPKKRLGFNFISLYFYMKHRNPLINVCFKALSPLMRPENFDPVLKTVKKENSRKLENIN